MSNSATENPVLLWGDMGPDVYLLSQIYDPRNDRYIETQDTSLKAGKVYYERLNRILTADTEVHSGRDYYERRVNEETGDVQFVKVEYPFGNPSEKGWYMDSGGKIHVFSMVDLTHYSPTVNPRHPGDDELGWYEVNPEAKDTCGKYVPAVYSPVVVDDTECYYKTENNYKTRMLLSVKSVDKAFNVTFAPFEFGVNLEDTTRSIDYGNEKFYLFFDRKAGGSNILLTPDRKLMLYGKNTYGYRLKRDGAIISSNLPVIGTKEDAFVPYARATGKLVKITKDNYNDFKSDCYLDVILPTGLQRVIQLPEDTTTLIPTFDITFRESVKYYTTKDGVRVGSVFDTTGLIGTRIVDWENEDTEGRRICRHIGQDEFGDWNGDIIGKEVFVHNNTDAAVGSVFLPHKCYLKSTHSIVEGETILMEVFSFDYETNKAQLVMSLEVLAKEATALDTTDVTTRQIVRFDVELNGSDTAGDIWYLQQGQNWKEVFSIVPKISFDDGSDITIPIDNRSCYAYGFENIKSSAIGREFQVLFKFFPHKSLNVDWQAVGLTPTQNFMSVRKTVKIINNLSNKIRKISFIPAWHYEHQEYKLFFMIFKNDFAAPEIIRQSLDTKYSIQAYVPTTDTVAKKHDTGPHAGEMKHYFYRANSGNFIDLKLSEGADIEAARVEYGEVYEKQELAKTSLEDVQYMNDEKNIVYVPASAVGKQGNIMRATLAERVVIDNQDLGSLYTQPILFKLAPMDFSTDPYKWLIGDDKTGYEFDPLNPPYGKDSPRPFLRWKEEEVETPDGDGGTVTIKSGSYRIDSSMFTLKQVLDLFYNASKPPHGVASEDTSDDSELEPTHFYLRACSDDSVCSKFVALRDTDIGDSGDRYDAAVLMAGGGRADEVAGGAIPVEIEDMIYGAGKINLMGTVIMEFVNISKDPLNPTVDKIKHLWAVPVEVAQEGWERKV